MTIGFSTAVSNILTCLMGFDTLISIWRIISQVSWSSHIQLSARQTTELFPFPIAYFAQHVHSAYAANVRAIKPKPGAVCAPAQAEISQTQNAAWLGEQMQSGGTKCILIIAASKVMLTSMGALERKMSMGFRLKSLFL